MTKEEKENLIELSDLNREDNIKYISSEAQGIAITLNSDSFAPSMCKLERAYICGRRKSEKRIIELEKENEELKDKLKNLESVAKVRLANWQKYEEENKELKEQIEKMKCCQNCKFEDNDCIEEPCSACTRCLGNIKRKGNSDKWEIREK